LANAFRLLLHAFACNLLNLFRLLQLPQAWRSIQIETLRARLSKIGARIRQTARCIRAHLATGWPGQPCSANSRSPSMPVSRLLPRQSVCLAPQGRSLLQKLPSSIVMQHFVLTAVFQRLAL